MLIVSQDRAYEEAQKYKEGKFILEKAQLKKQHWTYWYEFK